MQSEEPDTAISQGEVFLIIDLGCPSFDIPWLPRSYFIPDLIYFPFKKHVSKQRFPSNLH